MSFLQTNIPKLCLKFFQSYGKKLVCVDDKFSKPFKSYLGENAT